VRRRRQPRETRVVEAERDLGREVLQLVAGQAELGEDDQARAARACLVEELMVSREVVLERAEARCRLSERDPEHGRNEDTPVPELEPSLEPGGNRHVAP